MCVWARVCVFVRVHAFPPGLFWSCWSTVGAAEGSRRPLKETIFGHHQPSVLFFIYERCDVNRTRCCDVIDSYRCCKVSFTEATKGTLLDAETETSHFNNIILVNNNKL